MQCLTCIKNYSWREGTTSNDKYNIVQDIEAQENVPISALGVGNPPLAKFQNKRPKLPSNSSSPTTKAYKKVANSNLQEKKKQLLKRKAQSQGIVA